MQGHCAAYCCTISNTAGKKNKGKGVKCFNSNKYAGHIAKDYPETNQGRKKRGDKKEKDNDNDKPEMGMFAGMAITFFDNLSENNEDEVKYNS